MAATTGKERKGLGGEFRLPPWCQARLHTRSRCFVSSCATGVHIFHLFFHSSSDLSLKTQGRAALLRARVSCPAQKKSSTPQRQAFSAPNCSSATGEGQTPVHFCLLLEGCSIVLKRELTQHLSGITREKPNSHLLCSFPLTHEDDKSQAGKSLHRDADDHPNPQTCSKGRA